MKRYRFLISGGGTGGHIYPALAIADELRRRLPEAKFLFVGAKDRMEMEKVPQAGYEIRGLWISGIDRRFSWKNLLFPLKVLSSLLKANRIIREFKPHLVIGTGGFASGPTLAVAAKRGIPTVLQEQNSFGGITNKLLAGKADKIFVAYEGMERFFPEKSLKLSGNPVREFLVQALPEKKLGLANFNLNPEQPVLLVLGGSLGARRINELIGQKSRFIQDLGFQLIWQCGAAYYHQYQFLESERVRVRPFISDMASAYAAADLIISRAGAGAVSELSIVGKPVIFIPSPNVAEDHQTKNARAMSEIDAALLIAERDLDTQFDSVLSELVSNPQLFKSLGERLRSEAKPYATQQIVDEIEQIIKKQDAAE